LAYAEVVRIIRRALCVVLMVDTATPKGANNRKRTAPTGATWEPNFWDKSLSGTMFWDMFWDIMSR
jgi:hypothetical protein